MGWTFWPLRRTDVSAYGERGAGPFRFGGIGSAYNGRTHGSAPTAIHDVIRNNIMYILCIGQPDGLALTEISPLGGPMCPHGEDITRITSISGEFAMSTLYAHIDPPPRRCMHMLLFRNGFQPLRASKIYAMTKAIFGADFRTCFAVGVFSGRQFLGETDFLCAKLLHFSRAHDILDVSIMQKNSQKAAAAV